ncbi:MAG: LPS-assembly protein LptD, partial [Verrucomicrobia bacterium]|nr:LPS-assembly protein LptD [Verrucomicrobiota bacterium]
MRRPFALFILTFLLAASQDDLPAPLLSRSPDTLTKPDEDPISDLLNNSSQAPFATLPTGVEMYGRTIRLDGSINQDNPSASDTIVRYIGDIQLKTDTGLKAYADLALINFSKKTVQLTGNVSLYQDGLMYRGKSSVFNLETKSFETKDLRLGFSPIMLKAKSIRQIISDDRKVFVAEDAGITTHDAENPDFWLQSKRATIFPDDKIIFKDFNLRIGNRNLLWLPYLAQPFDANRGYLIAPGGQTNLGAFVKNRYGIMLGGERDPETSEKKGAWLLSQWHADLYSNKGLGMGVDFFDTRLDSKDGYGWLKIYYIDDLNPEDERAGVDRTNIKPNRFRAEFVHRIPLLETQVSKYTFDANLTLLSDEYYLEDFDPSLFRINRAPDNFLGFTRRSANSLTQLGTRLRLNDFYQSDTRLPEFTHDWIRQPFLDTPLLYESQTLLGVYQERLAKFQRDSLQSEADALLPGDPRLSQISRLLDDRGFTRFHTYHEFSLP